MKDITGQTFGFLTAIKPTPQREHGSVVWSVRCACGEVVSRSLRRMARTQCMGKTPHCGCLNRGRASKFAVDLNGARFGRLTVIAYEDSPGRQCGLRWRCECDCGNFTIARAKDLRLGTTTSCGCARGGVRPVGVPWNAATISAGERFGLLVVQGEASREKGSRHFLCLCDCGGQAVVRSGLLRTGQTRSCGCLRRLGTKKREEIRQRAVETAGNSADQVRSTPEFRMSLNAKVGASGLMACESV